MRDIRQIAVGALALLCLQFTVPARAWAGEARSPRDARYIEDPLAPHDTTGTTVRVGTAAGFIYGEQLDAFALGGTVAAGHRWGRLAVEAEYGYLGFQVLGPSGLALGDGHRLGLLGRVDALRLGPRLVGDNSLVSLYLEGGAAVAWNDWYAPAYDEASRVVPADTKRVEGQAGAGVQIEHRLQESLGLPRRVGWFIGWRVALSPHEPDPASICRGRSCRPAPAASRARVTDRSMLFQSSLAVTW